MPMDFPDMKSLEEAASVHGFRQPKKDEKERWYRKELAIHVLPIDSIEAYEILFSRGWNDWTDEEKMISISGKII